MRRSEMIDKLIKLTRSWDASISETKIAEEILSVIEEAGMLPPPKRFEETTSYMAYAYYSKIVPNEDYTVDMYKSQLWEPEEEFEE